MRQPIKTAFAIFIGLCAACPVSAAESDGLVLVRDGKPAATIVVARDATKSAQLAAIELQYHIEKITGAELQIVMDDAMVVGPRVLVGESSATRALDLRSDDFQTQEYLIRFLGVVPLQGVDTLVLMGRDKDERGKLDYASIGDGSKFPKKSDEVGTCYAVYDFLERHCDVRWYLPDEFGMVYPDKKTLKVRGKDVRRAPAMKYRWIGGEYMMRMPEDLSVDTFGAPFPQQALSGGLDMWLFMLRQRMGGEPFVVHHAWHNYITQLAPEHPDWFALGYGTNPPQPCFSNPEFINRVVQDVRGCFDGKLATDKKLWERVEPGPGIFKGDYFSIAPNDIGQWCKCEKCQAQMNPSAGKPNQWGGYASNYIWRFANKVASELRKTHPDKYVSCFFYWDYFNRPDFEVDPNVAVTVCMLARDSWWEPVWQKRYRDHLDYWGSQKGRRLTLWLSYCFPHLETTQGKYRRFPGFFAHTVVEQMKLYHQANVRGIYIEPSYLPQRLGRQGMMDVVEMYVTWKLADNPDLDGNKLIDEFFARFYGAAAKPMKRLYCEIEDTYMNPANRPPAEKNASAEETDWSYLATDERMARWGELMDEAKSLAQTEIEQNRVAAFEGSIWKYMVAGKKAYLDR